MKENWLIIDAHHHFFPEEAARRLGVVDGMDYAAPISGKLAHIYQQGKEIEHTVDSGISSSRLVHFYHVIVWLVKAG